MKAEAEKLPRQLAGKRGCHSVSRLRFDQTPLISTGRIQCYRDRKDRVEPEAQSSSRFARSGLVISQGHFHHAHAHDRGRFHGCPSPAPGYHSLVQTHNRQSQGCVHARASQAYARAFPVYDALARGAGLPQIPEKLCRKVRRHNPWRHSVQSCNHSVLPIPLQ
jgi:hypothetical protein